MQAAFLKGRVQVLVGDLTRQQVDAIVNAANSSLLGGGGVDGAIHRAGGPEILRACRAIRRTTWPTGLPTGEAVITTGGNLPARHVIHTVGPVYGESEGRDAELLASCYERSLEVAAEHSLQTMAFPAISTGVFHYPKDKAARVASRSIGKFLRNPATIREVRLVFFGEADAQTFLDHHDFDG